MFNIDEIKAQFECQLRRVTPFIVIKGKSLFPEFCNCFTAQKRREKILIRNKYKEIIEETISIEIGECHSLWTREIKNVSGKKLELAELGITFGGISFGKQPEGDYFYHLENPRVYQRMAIGIDEFQNPESLIDKEGDFDPLAGNKWIDPGVVSERIGASPYQPFPAILLSNYETGRGMVHGTLSQAVFYHNYTVKHINDAVELSVFSSFKDIAGRSLEPGEILEDYWYLGNTCDADSLNDIFSDYISILEKTIPMSYGKNDTNRHTVVWGSWNDGISRDIDEKRIVKMADFISKNIPTVEWVQIDDGYAKLSTPENGAHGLGSFYEKNNGLDKEKFPLGFKHLTDKIKVAGLKPALWLGGKVPQAAPLFKEHPDWFVDYSYRIKNAGVPDVSIPEMRDYMKDAVNYFINICGFEGIKQDFWSYPFEDSHDLLKNNEKSGYEWRKWWLDTVCEVLPEYAHHQTGCDIVMANPFLANHFTNYRYGIDIGSGHWDNILTNFLWGAACFALHIGDLFVPNSDGIGLFPGLTDQEAQLCINYCIISGSLVEASGWLYQETEHPRMKWVQKALCCPNNGHDVFFAHYDYRASDCDAPEIWYMKTPHFALFSNENLPCRTLAVFNLSEVVKRFFIAPSAIELDNRDEYLVTNVWTGETMILKDKIVVDLDPHESKMFSINKKSGLPQILDCNMKITSTGVDVRSIQPDFAYGGELEIVFADKPADTGLERCSDFTITENNGNWLLTCRKTKLFSNGSSIYR